MQIDIEGVAPSITYYTYYDIYNTIEMLILCALPYLCYEQ